MKHAGLLLSWSNVYFSMHVKTDASLAGEGRYVLLSGENKKKGEVCYEKKKAGGAGFFQRNCGRFVYRPGSLL